MIRKDYVPQDENNLLTWANNLSSSAAVSANQTGMGWTTTQGGSIVTAATDITNAVIGKEAARSTYLSAVADADTLITASLATIRPLVSTGKDNVHYTPGLGQLLGVIGAEVAFDEQTYQAVLRDVTAVGNGTLRVKFSKALGELDAARLFIRHNGQTTWTVAATMIRSPFLHQMTLAVPGVPEAIEVRIRGIVANEEIGLFSDIATVTLF